MNDPPELLLKKCPPMFCCVIVSPKPPKQFARCLPHLVPWHVAMAVRSDVFYPRRGVRGNGQIAMVGRGWKGCKKVGGGQNWKSGVYLPARDSLKDPESGVRPEWWRAAAKPTRGWYAPIEWTPVGVARPSKPIALFLVRAPRKNWVLPGEERGGAGSGYPPGGRLSRGWWPLVPRRCRLTGSRGRVGPGRWVAYDAAV